MWDCVCKALCKGAVYQPQVLECSSMLALSFLVLLLVNLHVFCHFLLVTAEDLAYSTHKASLKSEGQKNSQKIKHTTEGKDLHHRIVEQLRLEGASFSPTWLKAESTWTEYSGSSRNRFWISARKETPPPLWTTCYSASVFEDKLLS